MLMMLLVMNRKRGNWKMRIVEAEIKGDGDGLCFDRAQQ